jgi:hypothetical protein
MYTLSICFDMLQYTLYVLYSPSFIISVARIHALQSCCPEETIYPEMRQMSGFFMLALSLIDAWSVPTPQNDRLNSRYSPHSAMAPFCPEAWLFLKDEITFVLGIYGRPLLPPPFSFLVNREGYCMKASWHPLHAFACVASPTEVYNDSSVRTASHTHSSTPL